MKKYIIAILILFFSLAQAAQCQMKYGHIPRVKIKQRTCNTKQENIEPKINQTVVPQIETSVETAYLLIKVEQETTPVTISVVEEIPLKTKSQIVFNKKNHSKKANVLLDQGPERLKKSKGIKQYLLRTSKPHPNHILLEKQSVRYIAWVCFGFFAAFLTAGVICINLVSLTWAIAFYIAAGVMLLAFITCLIIAGKMLD